MASVGTLVFWLAASIEDDGSMATVFFGHQY